MGDVVVTVVGGLVVTVLGNLVGMAVVAVADGSWRFPASSGESVRSVSSHCDDVFQEKVNLALQDIEKGNGKMHFALRSHCESRLAFGCRVGLVE